VSWLEKSMRKISVGLLEEIQLITLVRLYGG
jgi:hypothetical protein